MAHQYTCPNYGTCASAGVPQTATAGTAPVCQECGCVMVVSRAKKGWGVGLSRIVTGLAIGAIVLVGVVATWKAVVWAYHATAGYEIIGRWRAEDTTFLGLSLPVGANLEFTPAAASMLDSSIPVAAYERDGNKVHVILQPDTRAQISLAFTFEDDDRMVFNGPLGTTVRYRRVRSPQ